MQSYIEKRITTINAAMAQREQALAAKNDELNRILQEAQDWADQQRALNLQDEGRLAELYTLQAALRQRKPPQE